jgi:hypothetical protein
MLKEYFIELYKLRSEKVLSERDINRFLLQMELTVKSVKRIIDQNVKEYVDAERKEIYTCI